ASRLQIVTIKRGSTTLHVWDDDGRATIYIEISFKKYPADQRSVQPQSSEHAAPFRFHYANNWSGYYHAARGSGMKRRSLAFSEDVGMAGDTPYGYLDSSATLRGFNPVRDMPEYTTGLTGIPLSGTSDLNVRVFDASRIMSPLTMPGSQLRGVFVDVKTFQDVIGFSVSHGQLNPTFGFSMLSANRGESSIDAIKVVLFPKDADHQYALNYAKGNGSGRNAALTSQVYSVEGRYRIDRALLNAELARDDMNLASIAGMKWQGNGWNSGLNFRDINKDFTTISNAPSGQGETGVLWRSDLQGDSFNANATMDVYRQKLYFNPDAPDALNYDTDANLRFQLNPLLSFDNAVNYADTAGEMSPRRTLGLTSRLTRSFGIWGGQRNGSVYVSGGYQTSRYPENVEADYDRYDAMTGLNIPLTDDLSWYISYQYSWLLEGVYNTLSHPMTTSTGFSYNKQLMTRVSGNVGLSYRNEQNSGGINSFMAGEDSVSLSSGLTYNPHDDLNYFIDTNIRNVWSKVAHSTSYTDMDLRMGMRGSWGTPLVWDPQGAVVGAVYKDINGNGKQDSGEQGIMDVKIKAGLKEALTDKDGCYRIEIRGKQVLVAPAMETLPAGFVFSTPSFLKVDIAQGQSRQADFGLTTQSGIYGIVFVDKNGDDKPDHGDQFIPKVKIILDGKKTITTDNQGTYFFQKVAEGGHTVAIDMKTLPSGLIPLTKLKNDIVVTEGSTYILHIPMRTKDATPVTEQQRSEQ
ncbi:MAG: hypothetical protein WCI27_06955, partial [Candidatus Omnitrophota bacterium]